MEVYIELAIAENFCMDFTLLYAAKVASGNRAGIKRIALASAFGACFAVVMPLFGLNAALSVVVKVVAGLLMCLVAGRFASFLGYLKFSGIFLAVCALTGGALIGIFSLAGVDYAEGGGYVLSSVPIGIPLFFALVSLVGARRLYAKLKRSDCAEVLCRIFNGENFVELKGFYDSGNKVYAGGEPVSVIPESAARKITDLSRINGGVKIHTVTGSRLMPVFTADRIEIERNGNIRELKGVKVGVSPSAIDRAVLHPDLCGD